MRFKLLCILTRILFIWIWILWLPISLFSFIIMGETGALELKPKYKLKENK